MVSSDKILKRLLLLHPKLIDLSLERMYRILKQLGNPERSLPPIIHVAGTNGKGSTIAYMKSILEAAGKIVHVYTSPHLIKFHERIRIGNDSGGSFISESKLTEILKICEDANNGLPITFFEITTAAAFLAFKYYKADFVLLETGLGGRLDATNVIENPIATSLTSINYDHQQFLGEEIAKITIEKAGIMKTGAPCIIAPQENEAIDTLGKIADEKNINLITANQEWQCFSQHGRMVYQDLEGLLDLPLPRKEGQFQIENVGTAIATLRVIPNLDIKISEYSRGITNAYWPGRMERLKYGKFHDITKNSTEIWLDGGHNTSAAQAIAASIADIEEKVSKPLIVICGMINSKDPSGFIARFTGLASKFITITIPNIENAITAEELQEIAIKHDINSETASSVIEALKMGHMYDDCARFLICGSLYLVGSVLAEHYGADYSW